MGTGVSAPEALVLICTRNDLFCNDRICFATTGLVGGGGVSVVCELCVCGEFTFQRSKSATQRDEIILPSSNFRGRTVGPICQVFFMDRCPKNEATAKNFVWNKLFPFSRKVENLQWGSMSPHPHWRVKPMTCNKL